MSKKTTENPLLVEVVKKIITSLSVEPHSWKLKEERGNSVFSLTYFVEASNISLHFRTYLRQTELFHIQIKESKFEISCPDLQLDLEIAITNFYDEYLVEKSDISKQEKEKSLEYALTIL